MDGVFSAEQILSVLDAHLGRNDYAAAEEHLLFCLNKTEDDKIRLLILNELAGLYRKLGRKDDAFSMVDSLLALVAKMKIENNVGAGTTFINCATVYKAFSLAERALPLFEKAAAVYEKDLPKNDRRFGGLYNNMALALVDLNRFDEAYALYEKAVSVMEKVDGGLLEVAITYLNIASAKEKELGLQDAEKIIENLLNKAEKILEEHTPKDGYYAFVCEKCASVFGYYGFFLYENTLKERVKKIYEGN